LNLSNNRKEKLSNSLSAVVYYTLILIFAANHFDDELFYSLSRKKNTFRLFEKSWFIIQMAYWLSTAIRNLQHLIEKFTKQIDCDHSTTPFIYLFFSVYAFTSDYYSGGMILITSHYITDLVYHLFGIFWIFGWKYLYLYTFRLWSFLFVASRVVIIEWRNEILHVI